MIVECPRCHAHYRLDPSRLRAGRGRLQCVKCREVFPVTAPDAGPAAVADAPPARRGHRPGLDVAVVALPPGPFRTLTVGVLARCGARSVPVDDGPGALEVARRTRPRLVVLGAALRGLTGPEVAEALRDDPTVADARLLLLGGPPATGRWRPDPARVAGVDAWLSEGARPDELEAVLRLLLEREPGDRRLADYDVVRAWSRLAARDLVLCEAPLVDAHLQAGQPAAESLVGPLRGACLERFPSAASARRRALLEVLDGELDAALDERRREIGA